MSGCTPRVSVAQNVLSHAACRRTSSAKTIESGFSNGPSETSDLSISDFEREIFSNLPIRDRIGLMTGFSVILLVPEAPTFGGFFSIVKKTQNVGASGTRSITGCSSSFLRAKRWTNGVKKSG